MNRDDFRADLWCFRLFVILWVYLFSHNIYGWTEWSSKRKQEKIKRKRTLRFQGKNSRRLCSYTPKSKQKKKGVKRVVKRKRTGTAGQKRKKLRHGAFSVHRNLCVSQTIMRNLVGMLQP